MQELLAIEQALEINQLRIIEPCATRWLAYENCVKRVLKIYPALLVTLEQLHVEGNDLASSARGLLLELRFECTIYMKLYFALRQHNTANYRQTINTLHTSIQKII
jgi:hypothetical protein